MSVCIASISMIVLVNESNLVKSLILATKLRPEASNRKAITLHTAGQSKVIKVDLGSCMAMWS